MSKRIWLVAGMLLAFFILIILPPIIHGYVYPNNGDDSAIHLSVLDRLERGENIGYSYLGRQVIGYPMILIHKMFGVTLNTQFLWFNFVALWLVGIAVYLLAAKLSSNIAGLIAIPIVMFTTPSVMNLFDDGGIFDLITVGALLPLTVLGILYIIESRKKVWIVITSGVVILAVGVHSIAVFAENPLWKQISTPINEFAFVLAGYPVVIILLLAIYFAYSKRAFWYTRNGKYTMILLGTLAGGMALFSFTQLTAWATRFATDLAIVLAILAGIMLAKVTMRVKSKLVVVAIVGVIAVFSIPVISKYYQYNSAVKPVDVQAMEYVKSMPVDTFSCSPTINPWIYERFTGKKYRENAPTYIWRSESMTSGTTEGTAYYIWKDKTDMRNIESGVKFEDSGITIKVVK